MAMDQLVADACAGRPPVTITAWRHDGGFPTATKPQKLTCSDNALYNVKFAGNTHGDGRGIYTEQVVALCAALIDAPVPVVELIDVPEHIAEGIRQDKVALNLNFDPQAGVHHGSRWADNHSERAELEHFEDNRQRFGALDVLYMWLTCSADHQWIYANDPPHHVLSVDHTCFLPAGPAWTDGLLASEAGTVTPDATLAGLGLQPADRASALSLLAQVDDNQVAAVVARPPDEWGIAMAERVAVAEFVVTRKNAALAYYAGSP